MKLTTLFNPANWFFIESRRYRLEVPSVETEILKIKDFAQAVCGAAGYSSADSNIVKLALEEVGVNIIRHAYSGITPGKIRIEMRVGAGGLKIKIVDQGQPFDFKDIKDPDLNHYVDIGKKGGLGIWFIRKMMTKVRYRSYSDHNEWLLRYRPLKPNDPEELGKSSWSTPAVLFVIASFVLFSFLIFLVYVLSCLVMVSGGIGQSLLHRILSGSKTNLGRGVLLVYAMGLAGFYLIFQKLFKSFWEDQGEKIATAKQRKADRSQLRDRGEYERLAELISEMEDQLRETQNKLTDQVQLQVELRLTESTRQEELRSFESTRKEEMQAVEDAKREMALAVEKARQEEAQAVEKVKNEALLEVERIRTETTQTQKLTREELERLQVQATKAQEQAHDQIAQLSRIRSDLEWRLQEARTKMADQQKVHAGMQREVKVAQQIQHALLPKEFPRIEGFQIGASYRAAKEVGGDYYDFIWVDANTLGIAVGDVAGKGVPGSMVMAMIRTAMRLEARNNKSPADVLLKVHEHVNGDMKRGMFATMFYIILDSRNRTMRFASAGHNPMILYRKSTDEVYFLKPKGFPLGIDLPDEGLFAKTLAVQKLSLQKDDVVVIYTDGVTEAMNPANEQFGEDRLIRAIRENADSTPEVIVQKLEVQIADFTAGAEQSDDVTIVVIKENMQAEDVIYQFRKTLLNLVEKEGLPIAVACRQMNVSPQTYYHYKNIFDKKGYSGLKPVLAKKRRIVKELSVAQKNAVLLAVKSNPEWAPPRIAEFLNKSTQGAIRAEVKLIAEFLSHKGLSQAKERKIFAANEIDTV